MANEFAKRAATDARLLKRSCEGLLGLCAGLMADGVLTDDEIRFLDLWLADHDALAHTWPGEVIVARVKAVLADGVITEDERAHLKQTLTDLLGGTLEETGAASGTATRLPVNQVAIVTIPGSLFCFTGNFLYGTRNACHRAVIDRGGDATDGVRTDLSYLVIGAMASRDWMNTSYGRKIEKAVAYQQKGCSILIVGEDQWVRAL